MPEISIPLIRGDKIASDVDYHDALPVNMYAVPHAILGAQGYMINHDGLVSYSTSIPGADRGAIYNERIGTHFRVTDNYLITVDEYGVTTGYTPISGTDQASLDYSFNSQCIVADGKMWLYTEAGGLVQVTDSDLGNPIDVCWIDGYYFMTDGEYVYHTDLSDETAINPLKYGTAEFFPDPTLGVAKTQDDKVAVFGRYSIEYFVNVASDNFAFSRVQSRAQTVGIVATHAKTQYNNVFYIVGSGKNNALSVYAIAVGAPVKIGTREIDKILAEYNDFELIDIRVEHRHKDHITFIIIHLPDYTLCFNLNAFQAFGADYAWSILKTDTIGDTPWRAINGVYDPRNGKWIYGDKQEQILSYLDSTVCTHLGDNVESILYSPLFNLEKMSIDEIELVTIPGFSSTDAKLSFSITTDGLSYGTEFFDFWSTPGDYNIRYIQYRLGYVRDKIGFKIRCISSSKLAGSIFKVRYS